MFRKNSGFRKFSSKGGGSFTVLSNSFFSQDRKNFARESFCFRKFLVGKKFLWIRGGGGGGSHDFPSKSFSVTVPKYFIGEHFSVSEKFFYQKFSRIGGGDITVLSKFFVSQDRNEKLCKRTLLFSRKLLVSKKIYG